MIQVRLIKGQIQFNIENRGWRMIPNGTTGVSFSDDNLYVNFSKLTSTSEFFFDKKGYLISDITDTDNNNTPFNQSSLTDYLIDNGFFNLAPINGYGTGQYITAISNTPQNINNTESAVLFQTTLESKGITLLNDSEFVFDKGGLVTVFFEFNIDITRGNTNLEFWIEVFNDTDGIFQPSIITGNVFELTARTEGVKTYIYQADVLANVRYRLVASTTGDVTFTSHTLSTNPLVSTIGAKLRIR